MIKKNDHIVITGGTGFLGGFIIEELKKRGYNNLTPLGSKHVDLTIRNEVITVFKLLKPAIVIHAGAHCGGLGANKDDPSGFIEKNTRLNLNVVEASNCLHKTGILKKFVGIGTVCSYPKHAPIPFKEDDLWEGLPEETNLGYGLSKRLLLTHIMAYRQQYGFPGIFLIPVNLYGPKDSFDEKKSHVIPALIKKIEAVMEYPHGCQPDALVCWGTGNASREFFYVEDAAKGIVDAMEKYTASAPVNLGNGIEVKIKDLVKILTKKMGYTGKVVWDSSKPDGQPRRCLDVSRAKEEFGFEAEVDLNQGLDKTIDWYKQHGAK